MIFFRVPLEFDDLATIQDDMKTLATDLDGTLIPLDGDQKNLADLEQLGKVFSEQGNQLVFVTGRHLESVRSAILHHQLPRPDLVICDVGTSIYNCDDNDTFQLNPEYAQELHQILAPDELQDFGKQLQEIQGLRLQESYKQGPFKLSFYCQAERLAELTETILQRIAAAQFPIQLIASVDPFNHDGLVDLLPLGVSKAFALDWWIRSSRTVADNVVFAGDSGNDLAAMTAGYRTIVVGNADAALIDTVKLQHQQLGFNDRLFISLEHATSGVLEGCRHWQLC